jgi:hypothetical protein
MASERYICKECNAPATVGADGVIARTCQHTGTILLDMSVVCTGEGGVKDKSRLAQIIDLIIAMVKGKP